MAAAWNSSPKKKPTIIRDYPFEQLRKVIARCEEGQVVLSTEGGIIAAYQGKQCSKWLPDKICVLIQRLTDCQVKGQKGGVSQKGHLLLWCLHLVEDDRK